MTKTYNYLVWSYYCVKMQVCSKLFTWLPMYSESWPVKHSRSYLYFGRAAWKAAKKTWRWRVRIDGMTYTPDTAGLPGLRSHDLRRPSITPRAAAKNLLSAVKKLIAMNTCEREGCSMSYFQTREWRLYCSHRCANIASRQRFRARAERLQLSTKQKGVQNE